MNELIEIRAIILADLNKVWNFYTDPIHIVNWNFASDDWCCPSAENDLQPGGKYKSRMEAKDGSFGFDFEATYQEIKDLEFFIYQLEDRRTIRVDFNNMDIKTEIIVRFDPENQNPIDIQRNGWQAILNNFKKYVELN